MSEIELVATIKRYQTISIKCKGMLNGIEQKAASSCFTVTKNFLKELKIEFDYFEFLKGTQKGTQII